MKIEWDKRLIIRKSVWSPGSWTIKDKKSGSEINLSTNRNLLFWVKKRLVKSPAFRKQYNLR